MKKLVSLLSILALCPLAFGQTIIAYDMLNSLSYKVISFDTTAPAFTSAANGFQKYNSSSPTIPWALMDDSVETYPADAMGIISEYDPYTFFGAVGTLNEDNDGPVTATWVFDISSAGTGYLQFSAAMAGMGEYEASDLLSLTAQVDNGAAFDLFSFAVDVGGSQEYFMDNGLSVTLANPGTIDGVNFTNSLNTFSSQFAGSGSTLTIELTAAFDPAETFAMRNMIISTATVPEPSTYAFILGLLALGFVAYRRRR